MAKKDPSAKELRLLEQAQELVYEAWEARTRKRAAALAREALEISPLCADAYVLLASCAKVGSNEELERWRKAVAAGEAALGPSVFRDCAGDFWLVLETRPYMRALNGLSVTLWRRGSHDEAIVHAREVLRLNPNDNQGARYVLAAWLAELGRDAELRELMIQYKDDASAAWYWTAALLAFRQAGDSPRSR